MVDNLKNKNENSKRVLTINHGYRHHIASQLKVDQSLTSNKKSSNFLCSVYPYENCFWNAYVIYEHKSHINKEFTKSELQRLMKNENKLYCKILNNELCKDFKTYLDRFDLKTKLKETYFTDIKKILPQLSMIFNFPSEILKYDETEKDKELKEKVEFFKVNRNQNEQNKQNKDDKNKEIEDKDVYIFEGLTLGGYLEEQKRKQNELNKKDQKKKPKKKFRQELQDEQNNINVEEIKEPETLESIEGKDFKKNGYFIFLENFIKGQGLGQKYIKEFLLSKYKELVKPIHEELEENFRFKTDIVVNGIGLYYSKSEFETFIKFFAVVIFFMTGIETKFFVDELGNLDLDFYASENQFQVFAEELRYKLQMRIIASSIPINNEENENDSDEEEEDKSNNEELNNQQIPQTDNENPSNTNQEPIQPSNNLTVNPAVNLPQASDIMSKFSWDNIKKYLKNAFKSVKNYVKELLKKTVDTAKSAANDAQVKFKDLISTIKKDFSADNIMSKLTNAGKGLLVSLGDQIGAYDKDKNKDIYVPTDPLEIQNLIPIEQLDEDLANFPPYIMFKCCHQYQDLFKRFDRLDRSHLCNKCSHSSTTLLSNCKCSPDCSKQDCKVCFYSIYRLILQSNKSYLEVNGQFDLIDNKKYEDSNLILDTLGCNNYYVKNGACSSIFRQIDKTRLLFYKLCSIFDVKNAKKRTSPNNKDKGDWKPELLKGVFIVLDYENYLKTFESEYIDYGQVYENKIKEIESIENSTQVENQPQVPNTPQNLTEKKKNTLLNSYCLSINETPAVLSFVYNMRNMYGEEVAFYFAWVSYYVFMLKYLAFYGMLMLLLIYAMQYKMTEAEIISYNLYLTIPFTIFVVFTGKIFSEAWIDKEKVFLYKWGMEEYDLEIENENLDGAIIYNQFLDIKLPLQDQQEAFNRKCVVWFKCIICYLLVVVANLLIFSFQYVFVGSYITDFNNNLCGFWETIFVYIIFIGSSYAFLKIRNVFTDNFYRRLRYIFN